MSGMEGAFFGALTASLLSSEGPKGRGLGALMAPGPELPKPMPVPDDEAAKLAKRRSLASQRARGGRASTILTQDTSVSSPSDTLGG